MKNYYIGEVVFSEDPTFSGRCKIRVFGLFDELDVDNIPWFSPMTSSVFSSSGAGSLSVPKVGDVVRVTFANGDYYSGEYTGLQYVDPDLIDEIKADYQNTHVLLFDSEKNLLILYQPNTGIKMYLNGSQIMIDPLGAIQLKHKNNTSVIEVNDDSIEIAAVGGATGKINISSGAEVNVTAPIVKVKSDNVGLGNNSVYSAVKGEKLVDVLKQISAELKTKFPAGYSGLAGKTFNEILSSDVKIT